MIVLIYQHDCSPSVKDKAVKLIAVFARGLFVKDKH